MIRRLLHALGWHWWTAWRDDVVTDYIYTVRYNTLEILEMMAQRRTCRLCPAEERRVVEA